MYVPAITLIYIIIPYLYKYIDLCNSLICSHSTMINACKNPQCIIFDVDCICNDSQEESQDT